MNSFIILWAITTIACMVLYHKTFRVVYFGNMAKAILSEFVVSAFVAGVLVTLAATYWWVIDIVLIIALLLFLGNQKTTQAIICFVLIVLISIVGIKATFGKNNDESSKRSDNVVVNDNEDVTEEDIEDDDESDYYSNETDSQYSNHAEKKRIEINDYWCYQSADDLAEAMKNAGIEIVYLENHDGYGFLDESLIMKNYDTGISIIMEPSDNVVLSFFGISTDMSLEQADKELNRLGAEEFTYPDDHARRYKLNDTYQMLLFGTANENEINIIFEPYVAEE